MKEWAESRKGSEHLVTEAKELQGKTLWDYLMLLIYKSMYQLMYHCEVFWTGELPYEESVTGDKNIGIGTMQ